MVLEFIINLFLVFIGEAIGVYFYKKRNKAGSIRIIHDDGDLDHVVFNVEKNYCDLLKMKTAVFVIKEQRDINRPYNGGDWHEKEEKHAD